MIMKPDRWSNLIGLLLVCNNSVWTFFFFFSLKSFVRLFYLRIFKSKYHVLKIHSTFFNSVFIYIIICNFKTLSRFNAQSSPSNFLRTMSWSIGLRIICIILSTHLIYLINILWWFTNSINKHNTYAYNCDVLYRLLQITNSQLIYYKFILIRFDVTKYLSTFFSCASHYYIVTL